MKCTTDELINKITQKKLNKFVEVSFSVLGDFPGCKRVDTHDFVKVLTSADEEITSGTDYNPYKVPDNLLECHKDGCINSGTFYPGQSGAKTFYFLPYDATQFASGIIAFYVTGFTGTKNVTVTISDTEALTNADTYVLPVVGREGEFTPVVVDLSATPTSVEGTGYEAVLGGAYLMISVADANAGISSIAVADSIKDFENNNTVTVGCIDEITGDDAIEAAEATCSDPEYDTTTPIALERTVVARRVTGNYNVLNPLMAKGKGTVGQEIAKLRETVVAKDGMGAIEIPDVSEEECGFVTVTTDCTLLKRVDLPIKVALDDDQYNLVKNADGTTTVYFNAHLVGQEVLIAYPTDVETEEYVADEANLGGVRTLMRIPFEEDNGRHGYYLYGNTFVTSFPVTLNGEETSFSFTLSIQRQKDGHLYKKVYIL